MPIVRAAYVGGEKVGVTERVREWIFDFLTGLLFGRADLDRRVEEAERELESEEKYERLMKTAVERPERVRQIVALWREME